MSDLRRVIEELARAGVRLWVEGGQLRYAGPGAALTSARRQALTEHRAEVVALLAESEATVGGAAYPASPWQAALFLLEQRRSPARENPYHEGVTLALSRRAPADRLQRTAAALATRHPILRASFEVASSGIVQRIEEIARPRTALLRIGDESPRALAEAVRRSRPAAGSLRPEALFWVFLLRGPSRDFLHVGGHHIAVDAWSLLELSRQALALLWDRDERGARQDMRYFQWLSEVEAARAAQAEPTWVAELAGVDPSLALPPAEAPEASALHLPIELGEEKYERIAAAARELGCTRYQLVLAAFQAVLHRFTGGEALAVASPMSLRTDSTLDDMVGYAVNTLPVPAFVEPSTTLRQLVSSARSWCQRLAADARFPLSEVVTRAGWQRGADSPIDAVLAYQNLPGFKRLERRAQAQPAFAGGFTGLCAAEGDVAVELVHLPVDALKFPVELHLYELAGAVTGYLSLSPAVAPWVAAPMAESLVGILDAFGESADVPISQHPAFRTGPAPARAAAAPPLVPAELRKAWRGHAEAVCFDDDGATYTYAELAQRRDRWAAALALRGVRRGDRVAVLLPRSLDLLAVMAALWERAAVYVPLDLGWSEERLKSCLKVAEVAVVVVDASAPSRAWGLGAISARDLGGGETPPAEPISAESLSHVYFTSGTTGVPKAVALNHEGLAELFAWIRAEFSARELAAVSFTSSPAFDFSLFELLAPSTAGGRLVCRPSLHQLLQDAPAELTMLNGVPGVFSSAYGLARELPPNLAAVNFGGEALTRGLVRAVRAATSASIRNLYGPSEATMLITCEAVAPGDAPAVSIGRGFGRNEVFVADAAGAPLLPGARGEVAVIGPSVGSGYWRSDDPGGFFSRGAERGFRTGDVGYAEPSGRIFLAGRRDRRVKIRGVRLELAAIEDVLRELPGVRQVAAAYEKGADAGRLCVYVAAQSAEGLAEKIVERVRGAFPDAAVPDEILQVSELPLLSSGKVDHARLRSQVVGSLAKAKRAFVAPRTPLETLVALVWADVLKLERVGVEDDFFAIGGHSLAAVEILATTQRLLEVGLPVAEMQRVRSVAEHCDKLAAASSGRDLDCTAKAVLEVLAMREEELEAASSNQRKNQREGGHA